MYLNEFPNQNLFCNETIVKLQKTLDDFILEKIPNSNYTMQDIRYLVSTLIDVQRHEWHNGAGNWSWSLLPKEDRLTLNYDKTKIIDYVYLPTCLAIGVMKLYLDKFEENNSFGQEIVFSINRGLGFLGRSVESNQKLIKDRKFLYAIKKLLDSGIQDYVLENYTEFEEIKPIMELFSTIKKELLQNDSLQREVIDSLSCFEVLPLKNKRFFQYKIGKINTIIEAPYTKAPRKEVWTKEIATEIAFNTGCNLIIGNVSSERIRYTHKDNNEARDILTEYHNIVSQMVRKTKQRDYMVHIILRGIGEKFNKDFEICTKNSRTFSGYFPERLHYNLSYIYYTTLQHCRIGFDEESYFNTGSPILNHLRNGWRNLRLRGFGENYFVAEVRIGRNMRELNRSLVADAISKFFLDIQNYKLSMEY